MQDFLPQYVSLSLDGKNIYINLHLKYKTTPCPYGNMPYVDVAHYTIQIGHWLRIHKSYICL